MPNFIHLNRRVQYLIFSISLVVLVAGLGLLFFGDNVILAEEHHLIEHVSHGARADTLYIHTESH